MSSVIVLGCHRSGTSLVAGICQRLGVNMGSVFRAGDESNPDGYFEDLDWRAWNKWIINSAGGTWYDPPSRSEVSRHAGRIEPITQALIEWKSQSMMWGFKDPRTCLTIHSLHKYLPNSKYVLVSRPQSKIVTSLQRRAELREYSEPKGHWTALTEQYRVAVERFVDKSRPISITVEYDDLVRRATAKRYITYLAGFLELPEENVDTAMELIRFRDGL